MATKLTQGDALQPESEGERIIVSPVRGTMPLQKEDGIWVFRIGEPLAASTTNTVVKELREKRYRKNTRKR